MESAIMKLEQKIEELGKESNSPNVISDHKKLSEIHSALAEAQSELDAKYARWAELEKKK